MDVLTGFRSLKETTADIILADPPYNIGKDFGNNFDKLEITAYVAWSKQWITEAIRVLKDTGTLYIYGFSEILAMLSVEIELPKRWLVWHYTNKNAASNPFWQRSHESIIVAWKDTAQRIFNKDAVREEYTETFLKNAAGKKRAATKGRFGQQETIYQAHEGGALPRDVIKVPALAGGAGRNERFLYCKTCNTLSLHRDQHANCVTVEHPTQKPIKLTQKLLMASKPPEGGQVVVPFAGTGSELLMAKQLGMEAVGFDINEDYCTMANLLIEQGFPQK